MSSLDTPQNCFAIKDFQSFCPNRQKPSKPKFENFKYM